MNEQNRDSPVQNVRWVGTIVVVDVAGDVDLHCSTAFQQVLLDLLDRKPQRVVVNLSGVPYMDSSGVASLVKLLSRTRKSGVELYLVGMTERVRSLFEITRLDDVFDIFGTEQEALG